MKKINKQSIVNAFRCHDSGFIYVGFYSHQKYTNVLVFDNDHKGNGKKEYLYLKFHRNYVKIYGGIDLTKEEKKLKWYYKDYENEFSLVNDIRQFTNKYIKSCKTIIVRKK
jgi:hypothetical protein